MALSEPQLLNWQQQLIRVMEDNADLRVRIERGNLPADIVEDREKLAKIVEIMIGRGVQLNVLSPNYDYGVKSILQNACYVRDLETIKTLLDAGVDPTMKNAKGFDAFFFLMFPAHGTRPRMPNEHAEGSE